MVVDRERTEGWKPGRVGTRPVVVDDIFEGNGDGMLSFERSVSA